MTHPTVTLTFTPAQAAALARIGDACTARLAEWRAEVLDLLEARGITVVLPGE